MSFTANFGYLSSSLFNYEHMERHNYFLQTGTSTFWTLSFSGLKRRNDERFAQFKELAKNTVDLREK
jgi:hypothetical protein